MPNSDSALTLDAPTNPSLISNNSLLNKLDVDSNLQLGASSHSSLITLPAQSNAVNSQSILETNKGWWVVPDFNGDKNRDIFWRNKETGENKAWLFSGVDGNFTEISLSSLSKEWDFKIADFDGNGKSDFFWRNSTTGENLVWIANANGNTFTETELIPTEASWYVDIGDFNGDGKNDLIWRNYDNLKNPEVNAGLNAIWLMNGSVYNAGFIHRVKDLNWDLKVGYANDDKITDLYWYKRDTAEVAIWLMNGSNTGDGFNFGDTKVIYDLPDLNWRFELGDTNGDGKNDLIWRDYKDGRNAVWLIDGLQITQSDFIYQLKDSDLIWDYDLADTNGDGKTDLIWRNYKDGRNAVWFVNGTVFAESDGKLLSPISAENWDFSITDANGDGKTDLIWRNYETGENQLWLMNGEEAQKFTLQNLDKGWIFN
ncbi:FG-GAP repeat domain-containing protein [Calothrix sp. PCC 6303]|uniref:FG-GAP repeat domain-containing protein n=1 Tax=Calothrix sp. PCC 6303 TaxID=1170562 RepID=UPI0002A007B4|nr:VCBS repeat-containing protein [Calothrix sp. PCC 6303]AFZ03956.1 FG-GAP repeat protein [Calothrix sp. PCC 6303]